MEFLEPRSEQGVLWLLAKVTQLWPEKFPWLNVLDLDAHFGYDLLVRKKHMLSDEVEPAFVEVKYELRDGEDFNHSFDYLFEIVCWQTRIQPDSELLDIQQHKRIFKISPRNKERKFTQCFLNNPSGGTNIEVVVLRKYLEETLGLREAEPE